MLVKRTLVPLGEYEAAKELVATDPHLQDDHRKVGRRETQLCDGQASM